MRAVHREHGVHHLLGSLLDLFLAHFVAFPFAIFAPSRCKTALRGSGGASLGC